MLATAGTNDKDFHDALAFLPARSYGFTMPKANTQSSLFDAPRPGSNMPEFSVGEISKLLKKTVEDTFGLVRVRGEISECKYHSNGHIYITLKDEGAVLASVVWRGQAGKLGLRPEVGMEVVCTGRITTYMGQSKYQLVIDQMALAHMGVSRQWRQVTGDSPLSQTSAMPSITS